MNNKIKSEIEKIEIPDELHAKTKLGIRQVKREEKSWKRYPKWVVGTVASLLVIGTAYSISGSHITDAAETLIGKIFSTEEQAQIQDDIQKSAPDPEGGAGEADAAMEQMNQHLELAKEHLSAEDFEGYSQLIKESMEMSVESLNPNADEEKIEKRMLELRKEILTYGIYELTNHTLEEARAMVSYPINYPAYIPEGYELIEEEARTEEAHVGVDPVVSLHYHQVDGEFNFYTITEKIDSTKEDELNFYDNIDSYQLNGYAIEYAYDNGEYHSNVQGMRITIPEEGYEILIHASLLSKEDMEKILLSMVDQ